MSSNHQNPPAPLMLEKDTLFLQTLVNKISRGVIAIEASGKVIFYNNHAAEMLDVERCFALDNMFLENFSDQLFGFSIKKSLETKSAPKVSFSTFVTHEGLQKEFEVQTALVESQTSNGGNYIYKDSSTSSKNCNDRPPILIIFFRDVTENRKLQEIAYRHERMQELGHLASLIAHEIRNPLAGIKGFGALLKEDLASKPQLQKMAQSIIDGCESLSCLASNILHYSRPLLPKIESTNLVELIQSLKEHSNAEDIQESKVSFDVHISHHQIVAPVDPILLQSALHNLIINAKQAMPSGGKLTVSLEQQQKDILIKVKDTGIGIDKENLGKIFAPFFTTKESGSGFGLTEVRRVVQAHHGHVDVRSIVGQGTTFTIKIPQDSP